MRGISRRDFLTTAATISAGAVLTALFPGCTLIGKKCRYNVLFIAVDDLRPQLGCYGCTQMITPNIDALAARGMRFDRTYCQVPICGPSRASLLSGLRPSTSGIVRNQPPVEKVIPDVITLPQYFKQHGYYTESFGKIFHHLKDNPDGWNKVNARPGARYALDENMAKWKEYLAKGRRRSGLGKGPLLEAADVPDTVLGDGKIAEQAIAAMRKKKDTLFFLAVGFMKPHMPFVAPKKYWDLYPTESIKLPDNDFFPENMPPLANYNWDEMRQYSDIPDIGDMSDEKKVQIIRGYYACVSFIDAQIGKLMTELDRLKLRDNTVVILWGDHGFHLGENSQWGKHTNFEKAARAPMILSIPSMKNAGSSTRALTEFVDIYPTLCEACGLEVPEHVEGTSMIPLLENPDRPWKTAAFTECLRWSNGYGYSMRTDRYRFTRWHGPHENMDYNHWKGAKGKVIGYEIYDHKNDPDENVNIANRPENAELLKKLEAQWQAGWKAARPKV